MIVAAVWFIGFVVYLLYSTSPEQDIGDLVLTFFMAAIWPITLALVLLSFAIILLLFLLTLPKQLLKHLRKGKS